MSTATLAERARGLADRSGRRVLIGIAGAPGAGKSTLAAELVTALGPRAALVAMDGFHLSQRVLDQLGRAERKGAPDTFDATGFAALLRRVRDETDHDVYCPVFTRDLEEPIAAGTAVASAVDIAIVEGNYLLLDTPSWAPLAEVFDETWFLRLDQTTRLRRLVERHVRFGRSPEAAEAWANDVDERNARLIDHSAARADRFVTL